MKYWINVINKDHVMRGVDGGFTQAHHGKSSGLKRVAKGDWIAFYSPKTAFEKGKPLQSFTAIGQVNDEDVYQVAMTPDFHPWRRNLDFKPCVETPIRPMIGDLGFIKDKTHWGFRFRLGFFEIDSDDFQLISDAMLR